MNDIGLKRYGNIYGDNFSTSFAGNVYDTDGLCPAIKCEGGGGNRLPMIIISDEKISEKRLGNLNQHTGGSFAYQVYDPNDSVAPTLTNMAQGGGRTPHIVEDTYSCAMRGRKHEDDGNYIQELEINSNIVSNSITSVAKDSMALETGKRYRIRRLTPLETWRLMNFSDEDYEKASSVNSKTQLLKEAGNAIVVNCLVAIFGQMFRGHEDDYKKFADDVQY